MALPAPEAVREFLASLGTTADEVYDALVNLGVYAWYAEHPAYRNSHNPRHCPVAIALRLRFPELDAYVDSAEWAVGHGQIRLGARDHDPSLTYVDTPAPVNEFITRYDVHLAYTYSRAVHGE